MIATAENMSENFRIYNKMYFEGKLPLPKFDVMHTYRKSGCFKISWFFIKLFGC